MDERLDEALRRAREIAPRVLPAAWSEFKMPEVVDPETRQPIPFGGLAFRCVAGTCRGLSVLLSVSREADGKLWLHVSTSNQFRIPSHEQLVEVKRLFVGDRIAYQVFPPKAEYVNFAKNALHLWAPLEGERITPDFRRSCGLV